MATKKKAGSEGAGTWKFFLGLLVTISIAGLSYYEWQKDRKPAIRYTNYVLSGTLGKTPLTLQTKYKNVGKTDATDVTVESRLFGAEKYDPESSRAKSMPHSTGTVGAGLELCPEPHQVDLQNSVAMTLPGADTLKVWWHDRITYNDEDGKPQPVVDICQVWDRTHEVFIRCPAK
jgi:hypothetical protein